MVVTDFPLEIALAVSAILSAPAVTAMEAVAETAITTAEITAANLLNTFINNTYLKKISPCGMQYTKMGYFYYTTMVYSCQEVMVMFRLKELRESRGISQVRLAIDLDLNQNSISRYESGAREADYKTLLAIADYFDVSLDYLFGRTDCPDINR